MQLKNVRHLKTAGLGALAVIGAIFFFRQCGGNRAAASSKTIENPARDAPWKQALWQQILVPENALLKRPAYLVSDPKFLEPMDTTLNDQFQQLGHEPVSSEEKERFLTHLLQTYRAALESPSGLTLLEEKIQQHFSQPQIMEDVGTQSVTVDYGVIPGRIAPEPSSSSSSGFINTSSDLWDASKYPQSPVVAGLLETLVQQHPGARDIKILICPLKDSAATFCEYHYRRDTQREDGRSGAGMLTVSPTTDKSSRFHTEWTHYLQHDRFDRWTKEGFTLYQSLRDQVEDPLAGALLEMDVRTALVIHSTETESLPLWRPDGREVAIRTGDHKWQSAYFQQVPRLLPRTWQDQAIAVWPAGQTESGQLAAKAAEWERAAAPGSRDPLRVVTKDGTGYEMRTTGPKSELLKIAPNGDSQSLFATSPRCHSLALSPNEEWLAFRDEQQGVLVYRLPKAGP